MIEHYAGNFPFWLSPTQAIIVPISEKHFDYGRDFLNDLNILEFYDNTNIDLPRSIIPIYAHAYNLNCIDTPYLNLTNLRKLESEGRGVGVEGGIGLNVGLIT